ncbi:hypothetical protein ACIRP7_40225 [Streptomyces sp. NPDC102270]
MTACPGAQRADTAKQGDQQALADLIREGAVPVELVDRSVVRVLRQ